MTVAATDILLHSIPTPLGFPSQYLGHLLMFELVHGQIFWATLYRVIAAGLGESPGKPLPWAVGFFFGNLELSMELWTVIAGLSGFDEL